MNTPLFSIFANFIEKNMKVKSTKENIAAPAEKLYNLLISFIQNGSTPILPQVTNWTKLDDGCSFTIMNMFNCTMRLVEQMPFSKVTYNISTDKNMSAVANFDIEDNGSSCGLLISVDAEVPLFLSGMVKTPLEQALNQGIIKIKELAERN